MFFSQCPHKAAMRRASPCLSAGRREEEEGPQTGGKVGSRSWRNPGYGGEQGWVDSGRGHGMKSSCSQQEAPDKSPMGITEL